MFKETPQIVEHEKKTKPIRASLVDNFTMDEITRSAIQKIKTNGTFVDYYEDPEVLDEKNMINGGNMSYVISDADSRDKYSERYYDCTGVIIVGKKKDSDEQISLMTHQSSEGIEDDPELFEEHVCKALKAIKDQIDCKTADAVIYGGKLTYEKPYGRTIKMLDGIIQDALRLEPVVITGPSGDGRFQTNVYFDTQERRLYIVRPYQQNNATNHPFTAREYDDKKKEWGEAGDSWY